MADYRWVWALLRLTSSIFLCAAALITPVWATSEVGGLLWEWRAIEDGEQKFDGQRKIAVKEMRERYDATQPFAVEIKVRPQEGARLAGIISDYGGSRDGGWYLAMGSNSPYLHPKVVVIDQTPYPDGYRSIDSSVSLTLGQWHTLVLHSDGERLSLIIDGELAGSVQLADQIKVPSRESFSVGSRNDDFFKGDIEFARLYTEVAPLSEWVEGNNHLSNSSFEVGETLADHLVWHRMTGTPSAVERDNAGWVVDNTVAWHGRQSLRSDGDAPLILTEEVWAGLPTNSPWVFSVYMKAEQEGVKCDLAVGAYWRLNEETVRQTVVLTTQWQRYFIVVDDIPSTHRRGGLGLQGPMNFYIQPQGNATVWVDAVQWEPGVEPLAYRSREQASKQSWVDAAEAVFVQEHVSARSSQGSSTYRGMVPLQVYADADSAGQLQPLNVSVPFARGHWNGEGAVTLHGADDSVIPVQTEILTRWPTDGSVQAMAVYFVDATKAGWQHYTLELGGDPAQEDERVEFAWQVEAPRRTGELWGGIRDRTGQWVMGSADLRAIDFDGLTYSSQMDPEATWFFERTGPLYVTVRATGRLLDENAQALLAYVARIHVWRDLPGVKVEIVAINSRSSESVRLRTLYWEARGGPFSQQTLFTGESAKTVDTAVRASVFYSPGEDTFILQADSVAETEQLQVRTELALQSETGNGSTLVLHAPEAWQRHPSAIEIGDQALRGYLWPDTPVKGLSLARGMALNREFWLRQVDTQEDALTALKSWDPGPFGVAAPQWWAGTDVILPFAAANPDRFAFIEGQLGIEELLGRIGPIAVEQKGKYGVFDYGDNHGDGGWGNLESFNDWAVFIAGLRTGDETALRTGFRAARHYRDIDMHQMTGQCYTHNLNHVLGGTHLSHAWPEGVVVDYLLTGSRRSLELILLHGEYLLSIDVHDPMLVTGTRNLGRYLTNVANVYQLTGDERLKHRFFQQLEVSKRALAEDADNPDRSIFSNVGNWHSRRLVPYHAWYGIAAMQKMYGLTGDSDLREQIGEEVAATLNPELYHLDLVELWPGVSPKEGLPIMIADFARHRGSFFYPVMMSYAAMNDSEEAANLALLSLYCWAVEGRGTHQVQSIVASTPLKQVSAEQTEDELVAKAASLLWRAAADSVLNSDFSQSADYWHHWRPMPGKSLSHHTNWQRRRHQFVSLDAETKKTGERSMRLNLRPVSFHTTISVDSNRFRLEPGQYQLSGWLRWDQGAASPRVRLQTRDLEGGYGFINIELSGDTEPAVRSLPAMQISGAQLSPADPEGWRHLTAKIEVRARQVANFFITGQLAAGKSEGFVWFDDFRLERSQ